MTTTLFERKLGNVRVALEWKLADLWVGAFYADKTYQLDVWVCLVPCLPIHITIERVDPWAGPLMHEDDSHLGSMCRTCHLDARSCGCSEFDEPGTCDVCGRDEDDCLHFVLRGTFSAPRLPSEYCADEGADEEANT